MTQPTNSNERIERIVEEHQLIFKSGVYHPMTKDVLVKQIAWLRVRLLQLQADVEKAFGGCKNCYGKGYSTEQHGYVGNSRYVLTEPRMVLNYCTCTRGEQLKELFENSKADVRADVVGELFKIEQERWKDAEHCTCLGYALVQLEGGEDSEGGKKMSKRLLAFPPK